MDNKLPKRTKSQRIGETAADIFSSTFTQFCNVVPVPQPRDFGIDFKCEIMDGEYPTGLEFNAQCKSKEEVNLDSSLSIPIEVTTINYWEKQVAPTFLFVYDFETEHFFWCFPMAYVSSLSKDWQAQQSVSIRVPIANRLSRNSQEIPPDLLAFVKTEDLRQKERDLRKQLSDVQEQIEEAKREYEAELKYQTSGKYEEYWADIFLDEFRHGQ